jgi:hypothetical protein
VLTTATRLTRRVPAINPDQGAPIPGGLVLQLADELAPSHVADMLRQAVIFQHVLHRQTLYANHLVFADDASREFVLEIAAFVGDLRVQAGNLPPCFGTVLGALFLTGETALRPRQPPLGLEVETGVLYNFPARKGDHRFEPYINTDHLWGDWQRVDAFFHQQGDEVAIGGVFGDGHRRGLASIGQGTRPDDLQGVSHLRKGQLFAVPRECARGVLGRLHPVFAPEFGIRCASLEEVAEGSLQMSQGPVVREAHTTKGTGKYAHLLVGRVPSVPVGAFLLSLHILLFFFTLRKVEKVNRKDGGWRRFPHSWKPAASYSDLMVRFHASEKYECRGRNPLPGCDAAHQGDTIACTHKIPFSFQQKFRRITSQA